MTDSDETHEDQLPELTGATKREGHGASRGPTDADAEPSYLGRGTLVGRYVVIDVLGEGGMGVVYDAFDPELDRKVAIKLLQAKSGGTSGGEQTWLVREAQALARLSHPNVVGVFDVGSLPGDRVFVAMEKVDGVTLRAWLKAAPRSWREVLPIMRAAGAGLAAAHAAGLVHRDFKPENVIIGADGRVRVMDFGLARLRTDESTGPFQRPSDLAIETRSPLSEQLTIAGTVVGTPAYMAPEIYHGDPADARTDQFAFGVALYEALFRAKPYDKKDLQSPAAEPASRGPKPPPDTGVPAQIQRVVMRAIAFDAAERYAAMDDLLAELAIDPTARRRRIVAGTGVLALAIVLVGGAIELRNGKTELCKGADRRLAGVWDPATKVTVNAAFLATKKPFAPQAFTGLERALDNYTGKWTATVVESCEATRVRGEQTEEVQSLRQACLDQRLEELRALTQLLANADGGLVELGDKVVFKLEPVAKCSNVTVLRAPGLPDPKIREQVAALAKKVAEAKADLIAGRYLGSLVAAQACVVGAKQIGYEPLLAEALVVRGAALLTTGNFDDASKEFAEATYAAIRGNRDDLAAEAGLSAAMVATVVGGKPNEARIWLGHAEAAATRIGVDRAIERRRLEVEGLLATETGDFNAGVAAHEKALSIAEVEAGKDSPEILNEEINLATTLSKAGAYGRAIPYFERALATREASVGPDHPDIALLLSNLGAAYSHTGDKKALPTFERSLALRERLYGKKSPILVATLDNFGEYLRNHGDITRSLGYFERAMEISRIIPGTAHPNHHQLATDYADTLIAAGRYADAHKLFDELFPLEEQGSSPSPILPATQAARADLALAEHAWTEAARFADSSITGYEAAGGKDNAALWRPLTALARARIGQGHDADARALLERALAIGAKSNIPADDLAPTRAALAQLH